MQEEQDERVTKGEGYAGAYAEKPFRDLARELRDEGMIEENGVGFIDHKAKKLGANAIAEHREQTELPVQLKIDRLLQPDFYDKKRGELEEYKNVFYCVEEPTIFITTEHLNELQRALKAKKIENPLNDVESVVLDLIPKIIAQKLLFENREVPRNEQIDRSKYLAALISKLPDELIKLKYALSSYAHYSPDYLRQPFLETHEKTLIELVSPLAPDGSSLMVYPEYTRSQRARLKENIWIEKNPEEVEQRRLRTEKMDKDSQRPPLMNKLRKLLGL
jgi:hypothetical protein